MIGLLVRMNLRERLASPARLRVLGVLLATQGLALYWYGRDAGFPFAWWDSVIIWVAGAGVVSQELATGAGSLVLARPVGRTSYVLAKWLALVIIAVAVLVAEDLVAIAGVIQQQGLDYMDGLTELCNLCSRISVALGATAAVVACSVAVRGGFEAGAIVAGWAGGWMVERVSEYAGHPVLASVGRLVAVTLIPGIDVAADIAMHPFPWSHVTQLLFGVTLCLTASSVMLGRREVQYGSA